MARRKHELMKTWNFRVTMVVAFPLLLSYSSTVDAEQPQLNVKVVVFPEFGQNSKD